MLKADNGNVTISGTILDISADMTCLIHNIYEDILQENMHMPAHEAHQMIMNIVDTALKPIEEVRQENAKFREEIADECGFACKLINMIDALRKNK